MTGHAVGNSRAPFCRMGLLDYGAGGLLLFGLELFEAVGTAAGLLIAQEFHRLYDAALEAPFVDAEGVITLRQVSGQTRIVHGLFL